MVRPKLRVLRYLWLRGWSPALVLLILWPLTGGTWIGWQGAGHWPLRCALGRGAITVAWGELGNKQIFGGPPKWQISYGITADGGPRGAGFWPMPRFLSLKNYDLEYKINIVERQWRIPLVYFALLLAPPPAFFAWRRWRRKPPWACRKCGYDLRGLTGDVCPECGRSMAGSKAQPAKADKAPEISTN